MEGAMKDQICFQNPSSAWFGGPKKIVNFEGFQVTK